MSEGCDAAIENTMIYHSPKIIEQIEKCGIPVLIERSSYESHPLGRLEWIRLYGLILGRSDEAEQIFSEKCALLDDVVSRESTGSTAAFFYTSEAETMRGSIRGAQARGLHLQDDRACRGRVHSGCGQPEGR